MIDEDEEFSPQIPNPPSAIADIPADVEWPSLIAPALPSETSTEKNRGKGERKQKTQTVCVQPSRKKQEPERGAETVEVDLSSFFDNARFEDSPHAHKRCGPSNVKIRTVSVVPRDPDQDRHEPTSQSANQAESIPVAKNRIKVASLPPEQAKQAQSLHHHVESEAISVHAPAKRLEPLVPTSENLPKQPEIPPRSLPSASSSRTRSRSVQPLLVKPRPSVVNTASEDESDTPNIATSIGRSFSMSPTRKGDAIATEKPSLPKKRGSKRPSKRPSKLESLPHSEVTSVSASDDKHPIESSSIKKDSPVQTTLPTSSSFKLSPRSGMRGDGEVPGPPPADLKEMNQFPHLNTLTNNTQGPITPHMAAALYNPGPPLRRKTGQLPNPIDTPQTPQHPPHQHGSPAPPHYATTFPTQHPHGLPNQHPTGLSAQHSTFPMPKTNTIPPTTDNLDNAYVDTHKSASPAKNRSSSQPGVLVNPEKEHMAGARDRKASLDPIDVLVTDWKTQPRKRLLPSVNNAPEEGSGGALNIAMGTYVSPLLPGKDAPLPDNTSMLSGVSNISTIMVHSVSELFDNTIDLSDPTQAPLSTNREE